MTPGFVWTGAHYSMPPHWNEIRTTPGMRIVGRWVAGEDMLPGRLVVLVGGVLRLATLPLGVVVGVTLQAPEINTWLAGDYVPVLRGGQVVGERVAGLVFADLAPARVLAGGIFTSSTAGAVVPRSVVLGEGISLNL